MTTLERDLLALMGYLMKSGHDAAMRAVVELDLSISQLRALFVLDSADSELALGELALRVDLSVAAMGRAVDRLVRDGYVSRTEDTVDRRVKRHGLTDAGREITGSLVAARVESIAQFVASLDEAEAEALGAAIHALAAREEIAHCMDSRKGRS